MKRSLVWPALSLALAVPGAAQELPQGAGAVPMSADDALMGYYAQLERQVTLPLAPPPAQLAANTTLTRIAFGSCNHQSRSQHMWAQIGASDPQLFMLIGDNVYGDTLWQGDAGLTSLRQAYAEQAAHQEFVRFRADVPMLTTWDDHDFGYNDGGDNFAFKRWAETIYETFWQVPQSVRARPGVYDSAMFGGEGRRVQIIVLDTRYFRSQLDRRPYSDERPPLGPYVPRLADAEMLGAEQWRWLAQELAKPADLRLIVSSIQVLTDAHQFESWATMPSQRSKLLGMLAMRADSGLVLLSGDRHAGGIYRAMPKDIGGTPGYDEPWYEITSSSLNLAFSDTVSNTAREPDRRRLTDFISEENFGLLEIDWSKRTLTMSLRGNQGEVRASHTIDWDQ